MSASEMSVETLKKSLAANGLAQYGTKEEMLHRLAEDLNACRRQFVRLKLLREERRRPVNTLRWHPPKLFIVKLKPC